jgi:Glycosyl hydrolases family 2, sugar binding domain.
MVPRNSKPTDRAKSKRPPHASQRSFPRIFARLLLLLLAGVAAVRADDIAPLARAFDNPPPEARLRVWWHWISGNITREGITTDLEAMQRVGLGGFNLFVIQQAVPSGPVRFGSPEYFDLLRHTAEEADRLGLTMEMTHSPGYSGTGGPWVTPDLASQKFVWTSATVSSGEPVLPQPETVADYYRDIALLAFPAPATEPAPVERNVLSPEPHPYPQPTPSAAVAVDDIIDLTDRLRADGRVDWTPPAGRWVLLRIGHTPTGKRTHPVPPEASGLECNKLDRAAVEHAFTHGFQPVLDRLGPLAGRVLAGTLIDSYESGSNEWCDDLAAEFERRAGYALRPWLPVFAGYAVGGAEESRRFLWDYRKVLAELYAENYYTWIAELARQRGLVLHAEGNHSAGSTLTCNGVVDVPMMEFWRNGPGHSALANEAISGAILYGRPRVAAESFSQFPDQAWRVVPENMKAGTDQAFASGINRLYVHRFAHQPWLHARPGMTMGYWGMWFDRTLTWWDQSAPYNTYVARAQSILQQGATVVDALIWIGEGLSDDGARVRAPSPIAALRELSTHRFALFNGDALRGPVRVGPGGLLLPLDQRIQTLVIAPGADFTLRSLTLLHEAVEQGLTLVGLPPAAPAGRHLSPETNTRFDALVRRLWGDAHTAESVRLVGRGRVVRTDSPAEIIAALPPPHVERLQGPERFSWLHRRNGSTDVFFFAAASDVPTELHLKLRARDVRPEIWDPETGQRTPAPVWSPEGEYTRITLPLPPNGSAFVVLRPSAPDPDPIATVRHADRSAAGSIRVSADGTFQLHSRSGGEIQLQHVSGRQRVVRLAPPPAPLQLEGPWNVTFASPPKSESSPRVFSTLADWSQHPDPDIRFFSGTAEYVTTFELPPRPLDPGVRALLDLGNVKHFAEITVNGQDVALLWRAPWQADVTAALRPGVNELRIRVTNTWVNRLVGDEHLPEDTTWRPVKAYASDHPVFAAEAWPAWVIEGGRSPHGRQTFSAMKLVHRDSPLPPSGLLGPVQLVFETVHPLD